MQDNVLLPIQLPNVSDVVYQHLKSQILSGKFAAGSQLNLNKLQKQLDVSRTPLKTALAQLQVEGLVEIHPRRGTYIKKCTTRELEECFEVRIALEAQALRNAFKKENQAHIQHLIQLLQQMNELLVSEETWMEDLPTFMDFDRIFHVSMIELSGNQRMKQVYESANVQGYISIMGTKFHYSDAVKTKDEHNTILVALKNQDISALMRVTRTHLENAKVRAVRRLMD